MALDELEIIIDVVDSFSDELDELLADLGQVDLGVEAVDDSRLDLDTGSAAASLSALSAQLEALRLQIASIQDLDVDADMSGAMAGAAGVRGLNLAVPERMAPAPVPATLGRRATMLTGDMGILDPDAMRNMGRAVQGAASAAEDAADGFDITNLRMSDLHNALAKLVPLILVYIGALPALIGGVLALGAAAISAAAALAAIGGFGALGFALQEDLEGMEAFTEIFDRVKEDFLDAFEPLARELAPLFRDALDGLGELFDRIADRGDVLLALEDDARAFGRFMLDWIPDAMAAMGKMAEAFGPLFGEIADALDEMNILRGLTEFMADAAPAFFMLVDSLWSLIKTLAQVSIGFMKAAAVATMVIDSFIQFITIGGLLEEELGVLLGTVLSLATAYFILNTIISGSVLSSLAALGAKVIGLTGRMLGLNFATIMTTVASWGLYKALVAVIGAATLGIGALVAVAGVGSALSKAFSGATSSIDGATEALRNFDDVQSDIGDFGSGGSTFYQFDPNAKRDMTIINAPDVQTGDRIARRERFRKSRESEKLLSGR